LKSTSGSFPASAEAQGYSDINAQNSHFLTHALGAAEKTLPSKFLTGYCKTDKVLSWEASGNSEKRHISVIARLTPSGTRNSIRDKEEGLSAMSIR
jgi:hypothetical protein